MSNYFINPFFDPPRIKSVVLILREPRVAPGIYVVHTRDEAYDKGLFESLKLCGLLEDVLNTVPRAIVCVFDPMFDFGANMVVVEANLANVLDATTASGVVYMSFVDLPEAPTQAVDKFVRRLAEGIRATGVPSYIDFHFMYTHDFNPGVLHAGKENITPVKDSSVVIVAESPHMDNGVYLSRSPAEVPTHRGLIKDIRLAASVHAALKEQPVCLLYIIGSGLYATIKDPRPLVEHLKWVEASMMSLIDGGIDSGNVSLYFLNLPMDVVKEGRAMAARLNDTIKGSDTPAYLEFRAVRTDE